MVGIGPSPNRLGIIMVKRRKKRGGREGSSARARSAAQQHSERDDNGYTVVYHAPETALDFGGGATLLLGI